MERRRLESYILELASSPHRATVQAGYCAHRAGVDATQPCEIQLSSWIPERQRQHTDFGQGTRVNEGANRLLTGVRRDWKGAASGRILVGLTVFRRQTGVRFLPWLKLAEGCTSISVLKKPFLSLRLGDQVLALCRPALPAFLIMATSGMLVCPVHPPAIPEGCDVSVSRAHSHKHYCVNVPVCHTRISKG